MRDALEPYGIYDHSPAGSPGTDENVYEWSVSVFEHSNVGAVAETIIHVEARPATATDFDP